MYLGQKKENSKFCTLPKFEILFFRPFTLVSGKKKLPQTWQSFLRIDCFLKKECAGGA